MGTKRSLSTKPIQLQLDSAVNLVKNWNFIKNDNFFQEKTFKFIVYGIYELLSKVHFLYFFFQKKHNKTPNSTEPYELHTLTGRNNTGK